MLVICWRKHHTLNTASNQVQEFFRIIHIFMFKHITTKPILWTASDAVNDAVKSTQDVLNGKLPRAVQHHSCGSGQCKQPVDRGKNKTVAWGWGRTCIDAGFIIK